MIGSPSWATSSCQLVCSSFRTTESVKAFRIALLAAWGDLVGNARAGGQAALALGCSDVCAMRSHILAYPNVAPLGQFIGPILVDKLYC